MSSEEWANLWTALGAISTALAAAATFIVARIAVRPPLDFDLSASWRLHGKSVPVSEFSLEEARRHFSVKNNRGVGLLIHLDNHSDRRLRIVSISAVPRDDRIGERLTVGVPRPRVAGLAHPVSLTIDPFDFLVVEVQYERQTSIVNQPRDLSKWPEIRTVKLKLARYGVKRLPRKQVRRINRVIDIAREYDQPT